MSKLSLAVSKISRLKMLIFPISGLLYYFTSIEAFKYILLASPVLLLIGYLWVLLRNYLQSKSWAWARTESLNFIIPPILQSALAFEKQVIGAALRLLTFRPIDKVERSIGVSSNYLGLLFFVLFLLFAEGLLFHIVLMTYDFSVTAHLVFAYLHFYGCIFFLGDYRLLKESFFQIRQEKLKIVFGGRVRGIVLLSDIITIGQNEELSEQEIAASIKLTAIGDPKYFAKLRHEYRFSSFYNFVKKASVLSFSDEGLYTELKRIIGTESSC